MTKLSLALLGLSLMAACTQPMKKGPQPESFNKIVDGKQVSLVVLKNKQGLEMGVTNYGGRIVSLSIPDKNGKFDDVVLGYNSIDGYLKSNEVYFGAAIGRYGNRIAKGAFTLDSVKYNLAINNAPNNLHGGPGGFSSRIWDMTQKSPSEVELKLVSNDLEEGFPGKLSVSMTYQLTDQNEVVIQYSATTDKATVVNLTNHSYFNLHGEGNGDILDHVLYINANQYTPVDSTLIPTGRIDSVKNTPFDFLTPTAVGARINEKNTQLTFGLGYDHNFVLNPSSDPLKQVAASVYEPQSGRFMEVFTNEPGIQFYCGNFLKGKDTGKGGKQYAYRSALCLETQHFPDSPNQPQFPSVVLRPGQTYHSTCIYKFSTK